MNRHDVACTYSLAIVATVAAMSLPAAATAGTQYSVVNLGSFGGVWGQASSIDDAGTIAGASIPKETGSPMPRCGVAGTGRSTSARSAAVIVRWRGRTTTISR